MPDSHKPVNPCPCCGAARETLESQCSVCEWQPYDTRTPSLLSVKITARMLLQAMRTISLSSLFLVTSIAAGCSALIAYNQTLGAFVCAVATIALGRTALHCLYRKAHEIPLTFVGKVDAFVVSFVFVSLIAVTCQVAFAVICTATAVASGALLPATILGTTCAIAIFSWIMWVTPVYRVPDL